MVTCIMIAELERWQGLVVFPEDLLIYLVLFVHLSRYHCPWYHWNILLFGRTILSYSLHSKQKHQGVQYVIKYYFTQFATYAWKD